MDVFIASAAILGEGPLYDPRLGRLYWVDIKGHLIHWYDQSGNHGDMWLGGYVSALGLCEDGNLICATHRGIEMLHIPDGARTLLATLEPDLPNNRPNDGKVDPQGRFWIGTMDDSESGAFTGSLYRYDGLGAPMRVLGDIGVSNGLDWSPDGKTFYYTDSMQNTIWAFDFDGPSGEISNQRVLIKVDEADGCPDGLCVAQDGTIFVAHWDGARVSHFAADGTLLAVIKLDVPRPTCPVLGGPDGDTLMVTSARIGLSDEALARAPQSGHVFACKVAAKAQAPRYFRAVTS